MAYFPKVDPVQITPLDLGEIRKENALAAMYDQRLQGMAYENQSRNALNDAFKADPSGQNVPNTLAQAGYGSMVPDLQSKIGNNALLQAKIAKAQTDFISTYAPLVKDQNSLDMVRTKFMTTFGQDIPAPFHTYYDGIGQDALKLSLGSSGNIQLQRNDATAAAVGAPAGVDAGLWNSINMARNSDQRAAAAEARAQGLYQGQLEQQGATLEHTRASTAALGNKPPHIMNVHPDPMGMASVPAQYDSATGQMVPVPIAQPQGTNPPQPPQGQGMGPQSQGGQYGSQGQGATTGQFRSAEDVKAAFKAGKLSRDQAKSILVTNKWAMDAETARQYMQRAGGDKEKARAMALQDGWAF